MTEAQKIDDGGPAVRCRKCGVVFTPRKWQLRKHDYECCLCKRKRQNTSNANDPHFKAKRRARNARPEVRAYQATYQKYRVPKHVRAARRKVATEIDAGRLRRLPCEMCGAFKTEAHHEDYRRPLDVQWLCRQHHEQADAMIAARKAVGNE